MMYMPPEQIINFKEAGPSVDIYAMGVSLYYLLSGRYPLVFPTPAELKRGAAMRKNPLRLIMEDAPKPLRERRPLPREICTAVDCAVMKDPAQRWPSAEAFRTELLRLAET
jgi:serine/threonine protein kinase